LCWVLLVRLLLVFLFTLATSHQLEKISTTDLFFNRYSWINCMCMYVSSVPNKKVSNKREKEGIKEER